jgi:hypothetical protein
MLNSSAIRASFRRIPNLPSGEYWAGCVSNFWHKHKISKLRVRYFVFRHLNLSFKALLGHMLLPRLNARLSYNSSGLEIRSALNRKTIFGLLSSGFIGACILPIPADASKYSEGSGKQTLRRKVRAARKAGVTWRSIGDLAKQQELIDVLHDFISSKTRVRLEGNDWSDLVGKYLWTVGFGPDGNPLLIAVTPYDGEWATLHLFVTLGETQMHSDARYYLTQVLVERLSGLGVRYLVNTDSADNLPAGLWHFQKMLGFSVARVRISRERNRNDLGKSTEKQVNEGLARHQGRPSGAGAIRVVEGSRHCLPEARRQGTA